ncbi:MAG: arsenate reductase ArsC [Actinobacteria bacterium]|nr:arsenate reductase ArsC [Actinomycetota bacterium]MCL6086875.1 arsenate reductase ArsC [Actinomycetota bacterium]
MTKKILILCTGNSCRSQMAEGFFKHYRKDWNIHSAGISPKGLNPLAVKVMLERDIDISGQTSDSIEKYINEDFDYVITVCDKARESCPVFPNAKESIHWSFEDPADAYGSYEEKISRFREIRNQIEEKIIDFLKE